MDDKEIEYNLLEQVALELQIDWIYDAFGNQVPLNQVEILARNLIAERMDELRK